MNLPVDYWRDQEDPASCWVDHGVKGSAAGPIYTCVSAHEATGGEGIGSQGKLLDRLCLRSITEYIHSVCVSVGLHQQLDWGSYVQMLTT